MLALAMAVLLAAVLAWAWIDGGQRPLRQIAELVTLPGVSQ